MHNDISEILLTEKQLADRVGEIGAAITSDYADVADEGIILISVLRGAAIFMADLARKIELPLEMDYMAISSYGNGAKSSGVVRILKDLSSQIEGRHVIVAEDILDSGLTLTYLLKNLSSRQPASIEVATLLRKQTRAQAKIDCKYIGFECPDEFIVVRVGLCGAVSQPALHRHLEAGDLLAKLPWRSTGSALPSRVVLRVCGIGRMR